VHLLVPRTVKRGAWITVVAVTTFFLACLAIVIAIDWRVSY
jgi:hypothetical protein